MIIVRGVFRALPNSVAQDAVDVRREVQTVPEYVRLRFLADSAGEVSLEAILAGGTAVGARGALRLAPFGTAGLECSQTRKKCEMRRAELQVGIRSGGPR